MSRFARPIRLLTVAGTGVLVAGGLVAGPTAHASAPTSSVTILLKAPNQAGLDRLATAHGLTHAQRVAALAPLLPSAATHRHVTGALRAEGFTITDQTAWTITAQAPSPTVASTFSAPAVVPSRASAPVPQTTPAAQAAVPANISTQTAAVLPTNSGPELFTPQDQCLVRCHTGMDFRNAYTAPKLTPSTGGTEGARTIATLQFAGWNDSDLTKYAKSLHLPDPVSQPVGHPQFTEIPVGQKAVPSASKKEREADEEVDLDQETILATDPAADQRAYFSPNNKMAGYAADLGQVVSDVTQGLHAFDGGDPHIVALSTSWGTCEPEFHSGFPADTINAVENMLKSLTAAGVTVFAASGDDGIYDCGGFFSGPTKVAVDYPASSPEVISVGGTRLTAGGNRTANTGANWTDKAWSCTSAETCEGVRQHDTGGSGGGESTVFRMPAYQSAGIGNQRFTTTTGKKGSFGTQPHRLVPDIADDGDPATGFEVLTSDPSDLKFCPQPAATSCSFAIGGTSLSSPEAAALFTDMLGAHGLTAGVGDIHDALYSAYAAHHGAFRDITAGSIGNQKDVDHHHAEGRSYEFPVTAQKGYDTLTGLGAPLWPRIARFILAPVTPAPTGSLSLTHPHSSARSSTVTATWGSKQAAQGGSLAASATVRITRKVNGATVYHSGSAPATGSHRFVAQHGGNYVLSVTDHDLVGQTSHTITRTVVVPHDDRSFTFHGAWARIKGATDYAGSHAAADTAGATAKATAQGRRYVLVVRAGPSYGTLAITRGNTMIGTYDLYSPTMKHVRIAFFGSGTTASELRTFTFRDTGKKNPRSTGSTVTLDALYVYR